jgi:RNA polymerase sigma-70 factor (ECF subfamily)
VDREIFDRQYLERLRAGDPDTERHFTRHFKAVIWLKLRAKVRSPQLIEDVSQETFLRVLRIVRLENRLNNPASLPAFVHSVCNNVMLELLRSDTRHPQIPENAPDVADPGVDPDVALVNEERKQMVRRILTSLPERDREVLRLVFLEEADKSEICRRFGVDADYLRVLLHRAKLRFRRALEERTDRNAS